uniref:Thioredoxin_14 domain-containing protein n=1 Tax=Toxocara canis TaxID=6265 RepID=A0A183VH90_TOXCA
LSGQTAADDSIVDMLADLLHEAHVSLKLWTKAMRSATNSEHDIDSLDKMAKHYVSTRLGPVLEKYLDRNGTGFLVGEKVQIPSFLHFSGYKKKDFIRSERFVEIVVS